MVNEKIHYKVLNGKMTRTSTNGYPGKINGRNIKTEVTPLLDSGHQSKETEPERGKVFV